jgi:hypothetical protein
MGLLGPRAMIRDALEFSKHQGRSCQTRCGSVSPRSEPFEARVAR